MRIQEQGKVQEYTNVWMQDSVFTYVEKELREMEDKLAPVKKCFPFSGDLFHFIEMELKKLNSTLLLETSPQVLPQSEYCPENCPDRNDDQQRTVSTVSSDGTSTTQALLQNFSWHRSQKKGNNRNQKEVYESLLCLKDLDQSPPSQSINFRSTSTARALWGPRKGAQDDMVGRVSSLAMKRSYNEECTERNSFKKRRTNLQIKKGKVRYKKLSKITHQHKTKNNIKEVCTLSTEGCKKCIPPMPSKTAIPCMSDINPHSASHLVQPYTCSGSSTTTPAKKYLQQQNLVATGSYQGIAQVGYFRTSSTSVQVAQRLPQQVNGQSAGVLSIQGQPSHPLPVSDVLPLLPAAMPVSELSRPSEFHLDIFDGDSSSVSKEPSMSSAVPKPHAAATPTQHLPITTISSTSTIFPFLSPAFLCICSAPHVCVSSSPPLVQTLTQSTNTTLLQQAPSSVRSTPLMSACGAMASEGPPASQTRNKSNSLPSTDASHGPPCASNGRPRAEGCSDHGKMAKSDLLCSLVSNTKHGGGLLGCGENEVNKNNMAQPELNATSTSSQHQENEKTLKRALDLPSDQPCNLIIQVPRRNLELEMKTSSAPEQSVINETPQKLGHGGKGTANPRPQSAVDISRWEEIKYRKFIISTRGKCLPGADSSNNMNKLDTYNKFSSSCSQRIHNKNTHRHCRNSIQEREESFNPNSDSAVLDFSSTGENGAGHSLVNPADGRIRADSLTNKEFVYKTEARNTYRIIIQPNKTDNPVKSMRSSSTQTHHVNRTRVEETGNTLSHELPQLWSTEPKKWTRAPGSLLPSQPDCGNEEPENKNSPKRVDLDVHQREQPGSSAWSGDPLTGNKSEPSTGSQYCHVPLTWNLREGRATMKQSFQTVHKLHSPALSPRFQEVYRADVLLEENKDKSLSIYTINYQLLPSLKAAWSSDSAILLRRNLEVGPSAPCTSEARATSVKTSPQHCLSKESCTCTRKITKGNLKVGKLKMLSPVKMQVTNVAGTASIISTLVDVAQVAANSRPQGKCSMGWGSASTSFGKSQSGGQKFSQSCPPMDSFVGSMLQVSNPSLNANPTISLEQEQMNDKDQCYVQTESSPDLQGMIHQWDSTPADPQERQKQNESYSVNQSDTCAISNVGSTLHNQKSWHSSASTHVDDLPYQKFKKRKLIGNTPGTNKQRVDLCNQEAWHHPECISSSVTSHIHHEEQSSQCDSQEKTQTSQTVGGEDILRQAIQADLFDILTTEDGLGCSWAMDNEASVQGSIGGGWERELQKQEPETSAHTQESCERNLDYGHRAVEEDVSLAYLGQSAATTTTSSPPQTSNGVEEILAEKETSTINLEGKSDSELMNDVVSSDEGESDGTESNDEDRERKYSSGDACDSPTHADQLPFRCEFCGRLFKHKRSRDRHVKLHTGDKKYKCCHCEAAFSRSDHLKIHKKTHDTQKPYQCSVCNRGYNTAAALTAHMQNHKAKLTAHALNQLLKDAQAPAETHTLTQLLRDSAAAEAHTQSLNHFLKDGQKLLSPKRVEIGAGSSPRELTTSPAGEPSPSLSPVATVRCPLCHTHCRSQAHLQRHVSRYHGEDPHLVPLERPASRGGGSGTSSVGGASSAASTPSPRPPSSLPSPRPLSNPLLSLVSGKLACLYCSRDGFPSLEALQLHLQSSHGSVMNGEMRDMTTMLGLHPSLGASLGAGGMATSLASPLGPGSSRGVSCELCGARVGGVTALQRHVVTAHTFTDLLARAAEGVFCAQCLLPFSNPGALAEHIKLVHASPVLSAVLNKRPPSPPTDTPTDLSKKSRHDGLTSDLPASTLLCSQCNAPFTNFEAFRRHLKSHLDGGEQLVTTGGSGGQLACPECRLPLTSEAALEGHLATHLGITSTEYGCQACLKLFSKPDELQKHLMDIHAHHLYRCALCKEMFDSKVSIQVHFAVKHSNECKVHKCTRCSLIFRSQSEFEGHIRVSHIRRSQMSGDLGGGGGVGVGGGSYRCLLCTLSLSSEAELAAHVSTHQRQFQCSLCDDAFHVEFLLDKHMQTQHNSELNGNVPQPENLAKPRRSPQKKDLRCDICDAEFSTESGLMTHRKQAHNIKSGSVGVTAKVAAASLSLFCAYCSEACKSRGDLEAHMKSHQGNGGRHKCNICDELCPSAAMLAQHKLTHVKVVSGSACAVCREPLTSEQQFTQHQNEHHPSPLPQPCVVCRQTLVTDMEVGVHARFHATQAAQAAAAASVASVLSSGELHPHTSNSLVMTTASNALTTTTNSSNSSSNSNGSRGSSSPRLSPLQRCQECHLKFETAEEAEAHAAVHQQQQRQQEQQQQQNSYARSMASSSRTYQCIKCQESFASEAEIEAHVASHLLHEGSVHECHLCRATFDTPLRLQCHLIEHTFEGCGSFTCYMCSSVFTTASRLQQHMVEHGLSARPYDCHHCHQRFFFRAELENHALSHPEAAEGGCRECLASFPDLPRRSARHPSLSCGSTNPNSITNVAQNPGKPDLRQAHSTSPAHEETDIGPTNGHASSAADSVED
ncbi:uncharacterized protein LOC127007511 isoform X2 [Eriocheir sinensis]|uniref:uncharacterized protein LOC127007511 isoform X2 n=1 Tax=Eriocheir sinensis TaxID=95602 RepID=UPI0021C65215|nr:uncharacterized protein LOC127007511 isoform X2 [Eriocheir sinensis]